MSQNEQIWSALKNTSTDQYEPMRHYRRYAKVGNQFTDRDKCQDRCDELNKTYEKPVLLELSPDVTPKLK